MHEIDKGYFDPIKRFLDQFDFVPPGLDKKLVEYVKPALVRDVRQFVKDALLILQVDDQHTEGRLRVDHARAVHAETYARTAELSLLLQSITVRHEDLRTRVNPRIGADSDEHAQNLGEMRQRLTDIEAELKARKVEYLVPRHLHPAAIAQQILDHGKADQVIEGVERDAEGRYGQRLALRKRGQALQRQINAFLRYLIEGNKPLQVSLGLSERATPRKEKLTEEQKKAKEEAKAKRKQEREAKKKELAEKRKKKKETQQPPNETPALPAAASA